MKALVYPEWGRLDIQEVPAPVLGDGEVLIRVSTCGICGSELESFRRRSPRRQPPLIMGHEFCGWVEASRNTREKWDPGKPVIAHALVHCGECLPCRRGDTNLCLDRQVFGMQRPGAFAEYVAVPERVLIPWPENVSSELAVFAEPLANGINAMRQGSAPRRSRVAVIGAGPIGLMCLLAAKRIHGSQVIVADRIPERLAAARSLGADATVNVREQELASALREHWNGPSAEYVIDAVGSSQTKTMSLEVTEPGGTAVWVGLHEDLIRLSTWEFTLHQKTVAGTYSGSMDDFRRAIELLSAAPFDIAWASHFPLDQGREAFQAMLGSDGLNIKAILRLNDRGGLQPGNSH